MTPATRFANLREREFSRLAASRHTYLDYTGSALYPESLVRRHAEELCASVLGNPHSENPASLDSSERMSEARAAVAEFFAADPAEYAVCFTANATAAIKLVGESFPFGAGSRFVLTADNHNSVNGIREYAQRRGARVDYLPLDGELRLLEPLAALRRAADDAPSLFAFPAQSNFSGAKHPLEMVELARERGYTVLLDAAAFVPTNPLSLREVQADFVAVSFYKMFGYPTGVGALLARRGALARLRRPSFAGGAVDFVSVAASTYQLSRGEAGFEDGTPNFLALSAIPPGLSFLASIGMEAISAHVAELTAELLRALLDLRHPEGDPAVRIYGPGSASERGGIVAFNLLDASGQVVDQERVVAEAARAGISLRGGCFCNPGATEAAFGHDPARLKDCLERVRDDFDPQRLSRCLGGAPVGAVRASLGLASNADDVARLVTFVRQISGVRPRSTPPAGSRIA